MDWKRGRDQGAPGTQAEDGSAGRPVVAQAAGGGSLSAPVGPITALAFLLVIGSPDRFACGKQIGSYLGLIPCEDSNANRQRLGHITKQGSSLVRYLLAESAQAAVRWDSDWRRCYAHLSMRRDRRIAKVAMARRLAISLYWKWRKGYDYQQSLKFGSHTGEPGYRHGVK